MRCYYLYSYFRLYGKMNFTYAVKCLISWICVHPKGSYPEWVDLVSWGLYWSPTGLEESKKPCCKSRGPGGKHLREVSRSQEHPQPRTNKKIRTLVAKLQGNEFCPETVILEESPKPQAISHSQLIPWFQPGDILNRGHT